MRKHEGHRIAIGDAGIRGRWRVSTLPTLPMVSTTSGIARRSSRSPTNEEGNRAEIDREELLAPELVAHHRIDARRRHAAACKVSSGRRENGAIGMADRVHGDAVDDQHPIEEIAEISNGWAEHDVATRGSNQLKGRLASFERCVDPSFDAGDRAGAGGCRIDESLGFVARDRPKG